MSGEQLLTRTGSNPAALVSRWDSLGVAMVVLVVTYVLYEALGVGVANGAMVGLVVAIAGLVFFVSRGQRGTEVRLYEDRLESEADTGGDDAPSNHRRIPYDDVDIVLRDDGIGDRLFGTGTFRLFLRDRENLRMPNLKEPDDVERILDERVPDPGELHRRHESDDVDRTSHLWEVWDADEHPDTPVVDTDAFEEMAEFDTDAALASVNAVDEFVDGFYRGVGDDADEVGTGDDVGEAGADEGGDFGGVGSDAGSGGGE